MASRSEFGIDLTEVEKLDTVLEMRNIEKEFPGVKALDGVDITLNKGEILALVGENGAGKSTLMKILSGVYPRNAYSGEIVLNGEPVSFRNTFDSEQNGIQMIYQEVNQILDMTIAENIAIGQFPVKTKFVIDRKKLNKNAADLMMQVGLDMDPNRQVRGLSTGQQQMIAIAKAISRNPKILVLDEPTSALTQCETDKLFEVLIRLKSEGVSCIYISHRIAEVFEIADRITCLRDGKTTGTLLKHEYSRDNVVKLMVGRTFENMFPQKEIETGKEVFRVENLSVPHRHIRGRNIVENVSFSVHEGEIFGLSGLVGSGRSESVNAIIGLLKKSADTKIYIDGEQVAINSPVDAKKLGIALISEDRRVSGIISMMTIRENITLAHLKKLFPKSTINLNKEKQIAGEFKDKMTIKAPSAETRVRNLSGGNQQKVVLSKWLISAPRILIMDEPTKGIDVGAKYEIYTLMRQLTKQGVSIIMISSELVEVIGMCDRIMVIGNGMPAGIVERADFSEEKIMNMATSC